MTLHVMPEGDTHEHVTDDGGMCPCLPVLAVDTDEPVWLHNSYDGREIREVIERAMAMMGCALTTHGHHWSPKLRQAFEIADELVRRHMPNHVGYEKLTDTDREACKSAPRE